MFGRKKTSFDTAADVVYDRENQIPVIRASICNGEQVAGFKDLKTGKFEEILLIRSEKDREDFMNRFGILPSELRKEY